ncbi:DUF1499 domain-containing protein [Gimesia maris]|uniref:DUF1499 domain-containing protein n=1 Tax=Gimesia maris TaxID=122 RepID=A0ABX5YGY3_9PLAN|nr:DUF1499 domain-containing protein [Gimesia maris]EDL61702.1 hypothetical protein PM8797T_05355 [Gimesia maris DSM 8797]QEG14910.1 hypothetical protein GmarT_07480 [Gimesia maris]QGQ31711.1 DUF1499 domain-containing protein [Gimesia maris]
MLIFWCVSFLLAAYLLILGINWVSKPVTQPGAVEGRLAPCPDSPNCVCSQDQSELHQIAPLHFTGTVAEARQRLLDVLKQQQGCLIVTQEGDYLRAEFRSFLFGFVDDVEFLFDSRQNVIQVRSASRIGHSDLGVNRKRIETIRSIFSREDHSASDQ